MTRTGRRREQRGRRPGLSSRRCDTARGGLSSNDFIRLVEVKIARVEVDGDAWDSGRFFFFVSFLSLMREDQRLPRWKIRVELEGVDAAAVRS